jgi:hypothetical protein
VRPQQYKAEPEGHTIEGGVLVGKAESPNSLVLFEDPQCPYCWQFEEVNGPLVTASIDHHVLAVEYRMRCFLGPESVRADNALALAAEVGRFDDLRKELFAHQPEEHTGGFSVEDLIKLGVRVGLTDESFVSGVTGARYEQWVLRREVRFDREDPQGTPAAWLNGRPVDQDVLFSRPAFQQLLSF